MILLDWIVLVGTLLFIVVYGTWKTRKSRDIESYLKGDNQMRWATIGLSVMATQASAITFLSTPGQAFESGMGFVQNYFGLPIALIIVSAVFIPIYYRLKVYTAYEYLENRFDLRTRLLAAFLFLVQRGLAAGITIYAPSIILSSALGWSLSYTILLVGLMVIVYTVSGGTKAVSLTQKWQMGVIMAGMFIAFFIIVDSFPEHVSFFDALHIAGQTDKLETVSFSLDPKERYTFWTGITGGLFLALSYFGTDQSQVQRYLGGKSVRESRLGLMFNAILKIPMQFFILLTGVMVFVFFQFEPHPLVFNRQAAEKVYESPKAASLDRLETAYRQNWEEKRILYLDLLKARDQDNDLQLLHTRENLRELSEKERNMKKEAQALVHEQVEEQTAKDSDYVFLTFIMNYLPHGLVGLLLAVILSAAMSSTSSELNALGSTTLIDFYQRVIKKDASPSHYLRASKLLTMLWGVVAITFAKLAEMVENLIEAVNILGSIFYGTILGIFLVAFFVKIVKSRAVFWAAILAQCTVFFIFWFYSEAIAYLWYNLIGCALVLLLALCFTLFIPEKKKD